LFDRNDENAPDENQEPRTSSPAYATRRVADGTKKKVGGKENFILINNCFGKYLGYANETITKMKDLLVYLFS
jgi:hypothetical protein